MRIVAPGKVVLVGEYAVLDGAPAVVAAIDRGVQCSVTPGGPLTLSTPGDDRFARAALAAVGAPDANYHFTDWNPVPTATKAGLGGSAAATVCACLAGDPTLKPAALQDIAQQVHTAVQGSGSGVDIAAAVHGGVLRFESGAVRALEPIEPVVVYSGQSAATGPRVERYLRVARADFVRASHQLADTFQSDPQGALREACTLLEQMTDRAGIAWWTPGLRRIVSIAQNCGGSAKPSGAGGGDCAVALFADEDQASSFRHCCTEAGFSVIPTNIARGAHRL